MADHFHYACCNCGATFGAGGVLYLCPACAAQNTAGQPVHGVLKTVYPYEQIKSTFKTGLWDSLKRSRFLPLLPLASVQRLSRLKVGDTPIYKSDFQVKNNGHFILYLKDDSQNPTFSFKDRASNLVSAFARENSLRQIAAASTGNAGSSLAGICASQGLEAVIFAPASAPVAKLTQIMMYGATLVPVDGSYDDAFDLCTEACTGMGWYNRNTAFNPLTIEGKKTVSWEIFDQLGQVLPDRVFVPVGDGVILSGVYKGFEDLLMLGLITHVPEIVAVQAEGSSNLLDNLDTAEFHGKKPQTLADSISVAIPRNFYMARGFLHKYRGKGVKVSDGEILEASRSVASSHGIFCEPAAAAAYAGMISFARQGLIQEGSINVVLLTGSGLKDLTAVNSLVDIPRPVRPDMASLMDFLNRH